MLKIDKYNKIIVANWKLNGSVDFARKYVEHLSFVELNNDICGIICPPSIYFENFDLQANKSLFLGAQNSSLYEKGSYTGEINAFMLSEKKCNFCIVGHSERREFFNESNFDVKKKAENLIYNNIIPIICIGESLEEKKLGLTNEILTKQISESVPKNTPISSFLLAYEPKWAIGSGLIPNLNEIDEIQSFIKNDIFLGNHGVKILYGGSVKSSNSKNILDLKNVDGLLVGGASLDHDEFIKILKS